MSTMPAQKPGSSEQTVCTPREFITAVEARFGRLSFDLAATRENSITGDGSFYGPGSMLAENALTADWPASGLNWCNPPYALIQKGMRLPGDKKTKIKGRGFVWKARREAERGVRTAMLIPASVATDWFAADVHGHAFVLPLRPRLTFVGHKDPYPKDLMLCVFGPGASGFEPWNWLATLRQADQVAA